MITSSGKASGKSATILLEDGTQLKGVSFGAERSVSGEFVFHTGMVGYTESITDPSYCGQVLVFSYPLVGNYGVPPDTTDSNGIPLYFESVATHVSAIVVSENCAIPSHWNSTKTLSQWLKEKNVPAVSGVDTRALIKIIREKGSLSGKIIIEGDDPASIPASDISKRNLVAEVSTKQVRVLKPEKPSGKKIVVVDCGVKANQLRSLLQRGLELKVVPWDYDFTNEEWDGVFISNGPGDPAHCLVTVEHIKKAMNKEPAKPMFGVCMGNQLMGLAAGAKTYKMKYGNRGLNQPCVDLITKRCHITSQNHGYVIDNETLKGDWEPMFVNANDNSNEGIRHKSKPFFSVQFHPEAKAGPSETEYLFDIFVGSIDGRKVQSPLASAITFKKPTVRKILILGSGGLSIGQAGEFDYSGSQAIKALKEEHITTVLVNPNVATVQTSAGLADKVYFLPVTPEYVTKIIQNERPDGILVTFGGQTALNCGIELYRQGILAAHGVQVLGTPIDSIIATEDRGIFAEKLAEINEKIAPSLACRTVEEASKYADKIGYPVIVRAAFCLGGLGSGFADNREQLVTLVTEALASSEQVLVERSLRGWKEIEYEVVRDAADNCITVCNMENMDPMGIHTGESIVVAPSQTLTDDEYQMLRNVAIKTVRHLGVVGECNIQYALNPASQEYCIIEVNAKLSRSSALASKATGYPLAFVAAKLALGFTLPVLRNTVTKKTTACFEPSLDYVVVKMPRWDLQKFGRVSTKISSAMKSVGEVMAIGRKFEEAIQKAVRTVMESSVDGFQPDIVPPSDEELQHPTDKRIFVIASALKAGYTVDRIHDLTKIDKWFLNKLKNISDMESHLAQFTRASIPVDVLLYAKQIGFSDKQVARCLGSTETAVREKRKELDICPIIKHIDTVAGEFPAQNNYLYMTYNGTESDVVIEDKAYIVLGSGAYRIGSSVEFDWCAVSCIRTMRSLGHKSIMVNFNPETVSTDYDECDYLFFEELSLERVLDIYELQPSAGVVVSVGGQIPNNLAVPLSRHNVKIIGTHPDMIDNAENRYKFSRLLDTIAVDQPQWKELSNVEDTRVFCESVGFPCLVRPSYVLSGAAMNVVHSVSDLTHYLTEAAAVSREHPVVISKFIEEAKEIEVDAVADAGEVVLYAVSEHVENAGVHSGDATIVCPAQDLAEETIQKVITTTRKIASALSVTGPFNIQFIAKNHEIKVIECNLRASRSFPFVSKTLNINFIELATKIIMGVPYKTPEVPEATYVGVKVPQFSFIRLKGADPVLGVEMASTGEVACFGLTSKEAYVKGLLSTGFKMPQKNILLSIGSFKEKHEFLPYAKRLVDLGYTLYGTSGTADFMSENKVPIQILDWHVDLATSSDSEVNNRLKQQMIDLFINLPSKNKVRRPASFMSRGYLTRRIAIDFSVPLITNVKCAKLFVESLSYWRSKRDIAPHDIRSTSRTHILPGLIDVHVHLRDPGATHKEDWDSGTCAALAGGFTVVGAMPNTSPPITDAESFALCSQLASAKARCDYGIFVGAGAQNSHLTASLAPQAFALKMYLEDTFGPLIMNDDLTLWKKHVKNWPGNHPLCVHATGRNLSAVLMLAMLYDKHIHVCHVSFREDIELIKDAKERGMRVSCETTPHHLFLTASELESSCCGEGFRMVKPHVGTEDDREALWANLDVVDMIATDHAPHTVEEKSGPKPPPGFPGLETSLPLMLTAVHEGKLTLDRLVELMHTNPKRIFNIPDQPDTWIEVEMDEEWVIPEKMPFSRCGWTVFAGKKVRGSVKRVVLRGELAYLDGSIVVPPGFGQDVRKVPATTVVPQVDSLTDSTGITQRFTAEPALAHAPVVPHVAKKELSVSKLVSATPKKKRPQSPPLPPTEGVPVGSFQGRHVLKVAQFSRKDLHYLFSVAHEMRVMVKRTGSIDLLKGKLLASLFYEPSTRTTSSFTAAMERLGGSVLTFNMSASSVVKGESLGDTLRTLESYSDIIVMRHPEAGSAESASKILKKPLINAGDGVGEHPTQALLDVFTIREELGTVNGLTITLLGDLKHGRTVHSLVQLLSLYQNVKLHYVSPPTLRMPRELFNSIAALGVEQFEHTDLDSCLPQTNVLYVTRVQKERFENPAEYDKVKDAFIITPHTLTRANENMIVMHPLPRVNEISVEVDSDPRAAYFRQMENGMYVRMALLAMVLGKA